jgi:hypothetical protein
MKDIPAWLQKIIDAAKIAVINGMQVSPALFIRYPDTEDGKQGDVYPAVFTDKESKVRAAANMKQVLQLDKTHWTDYAFVCEAFGVHAKNENDKEITEALKAKGGLGTHPESKEMILITYGTKEKERLGMIEFIRGEGNDVVFKELSFGSEGAEEIGGGLFNNLGGQTKDASTLFSQWRHQSLEENNDKD